MTGAPAPDAVASLVAAARAESAAVARKLRLAADFVRGQRDGLDGEFAVVEVATAVGVSTAAARILVHQGEELRDRFPAMGRALACGDLDWAKVRTILDRLAGLTDLALCAEVEARVLDRVVGRVSTVQAVGAACDRVLGEVDPAALRERARRAIGDRNLEVYAAADGMAGVSGLLPGPDGRVVDAALEAMVRQPCDLDPRTVAQRRADGLVAWARGLTSLPCTCGQPGCALQDGDDLPPRPAVVQVVVAAEVLAGAADVPGALRRLGVVDPETVRRLAADATWQRLLTLDGVPTELGRARRAGLVPGAKPGGPSALVRSEPDWLDACPDDPSSVVDPSAVRYRPPAALAELVVLRDGHCRFPGCQITAERCDLDHVEPFDHAQPLLGGWTTVENLACLCRFHHRAKTDGAWSVTMTADGTQHWTGPHGQHLISTPDGLPAGWAGRRPAGPGERGRSLPAAPEQHATGLRAPSELDPWPPSAAAMTREELWAVEDATRDAFHDQREREARERCTATRPGRDRRSRARPPPVDEPPPF